MSFLPLLSRLKPLLIPLLAACAVLLAQTPGAAPRLDAWKVIGPGGGGTMIGPSISPHDPRLVFEHCDMTGAYVTANGGTSWRMFNLGGVVSTFAFDPGNPRVVYAGNFALWRSADAGKTWNMIFPDPARNTRVHMRGDHAEGVLTTDDASYPANNQGTEIEAIAVDPASSSHILVAMPAGRQKPRVLLATGDGGRKWSKIAELGTGRVLGIYVLPVKGDVRRAVAITENGVYSGWATEWKHAAGPAGEPIDQASAAWDATRGALRIYATAPAKWSGQSLEGGIFVSEDSGATWKNSAAKLAKTLYRPGEGQPPRFHAVAASWFNPLVAYVGFQGLRLGEGRAGMYSGIAKTSDGGVTWSVVHKESSELSSNLEISWIEERAPTGGADIWLDPPYSLGAAPSDPDICYATDLFRTYRTMDGGRTWQQVNSVRVAPGRWTSRGLDVTTNYGVQFDPFDNRRVYIDYTDIGLFRSADGGRSWTSSTEGVPSRWRNTTYWLALDPDVPGLMWGAFSGVHDLPRPKMWRRRDPEATYTGGVGISRDGGRNWSPSNSRMPETAVTHILLDPKSPKGARTLYACGFGRGVYKSTDNGETWQAKNQGIEQKQPFAWRLTRVNDGTLYLVVARRNERAEAGSEGDGALYRSTDGAEHWVRMPLPAGVNGPNAITVDPAEPQRLYLSAWGIEHPGSDDTGGGVYLSVDGGRNWRNIFDRGQHVYDLTIDPKDHRRLFICGFDAAAYRSDDSGRTWSRIRGYDFKWGHRVIVDPVNPGMIYITTFGGSVWHGPAAGDPGSGEDMAR